MTVYPIPTYRSDDGRMLQFVRVANVPGYSHRVRIGGVQVDWLSSTVRPSATAAAYFLTKHPARSTDATRPALER